MKVNAVSNHNYAQNNKNQNFKGLYFTEKTLQTIAQNCSIEEVKILKAAAADKIDLRSLLHSDVTNPIREHLFLKLGDSASDLKLLYEPHIDYRSTTHNKQHLHYYALGGRFKILGYVPPLPKSSDCVFDANGYIKEGRKIPQLNVVLDDNNTSCFEVYAACLAAIDIEHIKLVLKHNGIIPNEACPIPTKEFVREIVKKVYNYLINENVKYLDKAENAVEKTKLLKETDVLRQKYIKEQLGNFIYTV